MTRAGLDAIRANARYRRSLRGRLDAAVREADGPDEAAAIQASFDEEIDRRIDERHEPPERDDSSW